MIVACGEALIDMVPLPDDTGTFQARAGGCPLNTAVAAARLGAKVSFLGRIGDDFLGDRLARTLEENGIDRRFVVRSRQPTTLAFVEHGPEGERYAFYSRGDADRSLEPRDLPPDLGGETAFLMVGSISLLQEPAASTITSLVERESSRLSVSFDPNIRPSLVSDEKGYRKRLERMIAASVIVKASITDLTWMFPGLEEEECARRLLGLGPELVVVTMGGKGSEARTRARMAFIPAPKVDVVDTIGAGDAYHGALLYLNEVAGRVTRQSIAALTATELQKILSFCGASAALTCTRRGADPPTLTDVEAFMERGAKA